MDGDIERHNHEIHENAECWIKKPILKKIYHEFYHKISMFLVDADNVVTVEVGSGLGKIKEVIPGCITSDLFDNPWIDKKENAYNLSFESESIGNLILFDVFHHLQYPGEALKEIMRVLQPGGRLIIFEPAISVFSLFVYGIFHHEPLGLMRPITWHAPSEFDSKQQSYYAAQANCTRVFMQMNKLVLSDNWKIIEVERFASFSYLCSGGFGGPQLYPGKMFPLMQFIDRILSKLPMLFAARMLVVLEKPAL